LLSGIEQVSIGLGDNDDVGQLGHTSLDALEVVAANGRYQEHEDVDHVVNLRLALTDAHRLDEDDVESCGLAHKHGFSRAPRDATECTARRRGPDVRIRV